MLWLWSLRSGDPGGLRLHVRLEHRFVNLMVSWGIDDMGHDPKSVGVYPTTGNAHSSYTRKFPSYYDARTRLY